MFYFRLLWISLLFLLPAEKEKWVISENSNLVVNGSTNVNKFSCEIPAYDQTDTLVFNRNNKETALSGTIGLPVGSFDCHNSMMTRDLRKTLKETAYPRLYIHFLSLNGLTELTAKPQSISGQVNITLSGVTKHFKINYQVSVDAEKVIHLLGRRTVNFSDFNLTPPRKLGGMIRTNNELDVTFHLKMKSI